ncbi:MAG TPA: hypothetical protein VHE37_13500 [Nevskiaceae bacterium]|nr:hypothetical protein [Nevskiaceae bacterium]
MNKRKQDFVKDKEDQGAPAYYSGGAQRGGNGKSQYANERNASSSSRGPARPRPEQDDALSSRGSA